MLTGEGGVQGLVTLDVSVCVCEHACIHMVCMCNGLSVGACICMYTWMWFVYVFLYVYSMYMWSVYIAHKCVRVCIQVCIWVFMGVNMFMM